MPSADTHLLNRESSIVRGSFRKVLSNSRLLKLNFGIMCLHILLMSSFVALPLAMEKPGWRPASIGSSTVTMLVSFAAVVPFIIYAEKYRRMKQVFMGCVAVLFCAEVLLWLSGAHLWGIIAGVQLFFMAFNVMEAILPSLISKESPAGYKGTAMGVYSTSQFIGVAIGGSLGGWLYGLQGRARCLSPAPCWPRFGSGQQHHERAAVCQQPAHYAVGTGGEGFGAGKPPEGAARRGRGDRGTGRAQRLRQGGYQADQSRSAGSAGQFAVKNQGRQCRPRRD